jgi:hypothetical protein
VRRQGSVVCAVRPCAERTRGPSQAAETLSALFNTEAPAKLCLDAYRFFEIVRGGTGRAVSSQTHEIPARACAVAQVLECRVRQPAEVWEDAVLNVGA